MLLVYHGHSSAKKFFTAGTAPSYDSVVNITTFGRDRAWKDKILDIVRTCCEGPVLDLACGTGILMSMIQQTGRYVTGLDLTSEYLDIARHKKGSLFVQGAAELLPYRNGVFAAVVSSYLAKYADLELVVDECWRVSRQGGVLVFHDFACPQNSAVRNIWNVYFSVLRVAGVFSKSWKPVFDELDKVICESNWVDGATKAMQKRGFRGVSCRRYTAGTAAIVWGTRP